MVVHWTIINIALNAETKDYRLYVQYDCTLVISVSLIRNNNWGLSMNVNHTQQLFLRIFRRRSPRNWGAFRSTRRICNKQKFHFPFGKFITAESNERWTIFCINWFRLWQLLKENEVIETKRVCLIDRWPQRTDIRSHSVLR